MKRLLTLILAAFVFTFTAPLAVHNASAADDAATSATDDAMKGGDDHGSPANENNKTNGTKHTHAHHGHKHKHQHAHKHKHHKKAAAEKSGDAAGSDAGK